MKKIRQIILSTAIVTTTFTNVIQPTQAQTGNFSVAGRWQCQNATRGLTKQTSIVAVLQEMIIDAFPDGTFKTQVIEKNAYETSQIVGGGHWQIQQNNLVFNGQGQSSSPLSYGIPVPILVMGSFQNANTIAANLNDGHFANSYACKKI